MVSRLKLSFLEAMVGRAGIVANDYTNRKLSQLGQATGSVQLHKDAVYFDATTRVCATQQMDLFPQIGHVIVQPPRT